MEVIWMCKVIFSDHLYIDMIIQDIYCIVFSEKITWKILKYLIHWKIIYTENENICHSGNISPPI